MPPVAGGEMGLVAFAAATGLDGTGGCGVLIGPGIGIGAGAGLGATGGTGFGGTTGITLATALDAGGVGLSGSRCGFVGVLLGALMTLGVALGVGLLLTGSAGEASTGKTAWGVTALDSGLAALATTTGVVVRHHQKPPPASNATEIATINAIQTMDTCDRESS